MKYVSTYSIYEKNCLVEIFKNSVLINSKKQYSVIPEF